jgi:hypothetical protein
VEAITAIYLKISIVVDEDVHDGGGDDDHDDDDDDVYFT